MVRSLVRLSGGRVPSDDASLCLEDQCTDTLNVVRNMHKGQWKCFA